MGIKGDKITNKSGQNVELFLEKTASIDGITSKKMFGGYGIFHQGKMFAIVDSKGNLFLKADGQLKEELLTGGGEQHSRMPYYSIPEARLEDFDKFLQWVHSSIEISKT